MGSFLFIAAMIILAYLINKKISIPKERFEKNQISKKLMKLSDNFIILNNLYIPKKNGSTAKIDHLVISHNGLYIIEVKNYSGFIMGSETSQYWTQIYNNQKMSFYNPIIQNSIHIKALKYYLGEALYEVPIYSVIVFGKQATLKLDKPIRNATVIKSRKLLSYLQKDSKDVFVYYSKRQNINQILSSLNLEQKKAKKCTGKVGITDFKQYSFFRHNQVQMKVCPRCGAKIVTRKGKNGEFKACLYYPKCKFNIELDMKDNECQTHGRG